MVVLIPLNLALRYRFFVVFVVSWNSSVSPPLTHIASLRREITDSDFTRSLIIRLDSDINDYQSVLTHRKSAREGQPEVFSRHRQFQLEWLTLGDTLSVSVKSIGSSRPRSTIVRGQKTLKEE